MGSDAISIAARIVAASDRSHPADAVLREVLKSERGLSRRQGGEVSRAVFAFYRWRGWLDPSQSIELRVVKALGLARDFSLRRGAFPRADLTVRSVPGWITEELPVTLPFAAALQSETRLWLRARAGQGRALAATLGDCALFGPGALSDTLEYHGATDLFRTVPFREGRFEVQDLSSQAVGLICAPKASETWWDACAGEGGKTLHLSDLMGNKGLIWATDRAEWRLKRLRQRAARAGVFNFRAATWDGSAALPTRTKFDGVLVDAPCSGVGTWHRNPHARWTTELRDVKELAEVQKTLLCHAARAVKPGGRLIYSVCTLTHSETHDVARGFEQVSPTFERIRIANPLTAPAPTQAEIMLWPQDFGGNGMFIAAWKRSGG